jgi:hypothetical protein
MQLLIKYGNIVLTTTTGLRVRYHLCLLLLIRVGGYIVNLLDFYSYRIIGKLTAFFASSGVQLAQTNPSGQFHFRRAAFSSMLKSRVGNILDKTAALRINLNLDGAPITSKSHTHPSHSQTFCIFRCSSSTTNPVYERRVNLLVCSLPLHRHSYIGFVFSFRFIDS